MKTVTFASFLSSPAAIKDAVEAFSKAQQDPVGDSGAVLGGHLEHKLRDPSYQNWLSMLLDLRTNNPAQFEAEVLSLAVLNGHRVSPLENGSVPRAGVSHERERVAEMLASHALAFLVGACCAVSFIYAMAGPLS